MSKASRNVVELIGRLGHDPELKTTNTNQVPVCNIRIATNEGYKDAQGNRHENTTWHTVVCYRRLAEVVSQYTHKGSLVFIEGRLTTREYMGKATDQNGNILYQAQNVPLMVKKYAVEVVANDVQFLDKREDNNAYQANVAVNPAGNQGFVSVSTQPNAAAPTNVQNAGFATAPTTTVQPNAGFATGAPAAQADPNAGTYVQPVIVEPPAGV